MSNVHSLADVKAKYGEKVIETGTSFVVNAYGKYQPNVSFVLAKDFGGDPLKYRSDAPAREMIAGMGLGFGTSESGVSVLFGDFWSSKSGKPHFRPKSPQAATHVIVRADWGGFNHPRTRGSWSAPEGAAYFRRASSNGGGTGYDYYVVPVGYYLVVRDEELDGDTVVTPDFTERAKVVRASFAAFDRTAAEQAIAETKARADAEAASRKARASGLGARLEAVQVRLNALRLSDSSIGYSELKLGESYFVFGWGNQLYTEANVRNVEHNIERWEEEVAEKLRKQLDRTEFQPQFEEFAPRVEALGLTLSCGEEGVNWRGSRYIGFLYSQEGLESFKSALAREEEEAAKKAREEAAAAAKASAEAEAAQLGLPSDVRIWRRMGGVNNRGCGWVIRPDGTHRLADNEQWLDAGRYGRNSDGYLVWNQILTGELVLKYHQSSRYDIAHCEVVHRPEVLTPAQLTAAKQIEEEMRASENAFGLDDRLGRLLDRRATAIEEAMADLPSALRPADGWTLEVLSSPNGTHLEADADSWVDQRQPFPLSCEGREAQVVFELPAADGVLQVVGYYKWGYWNLNLWWREDSGVTSESEVASEEPGATMEDLLAKFGKKY